jgi:hypothetical protein
LARYTTQIRSLVESGYPIFDFEYPLFDEKYRSVLEEKIINRYYFREIGFETAAQFKHFLKMKLNEIMPYYNEHYLALEVFKTYDPYVNKDLTTTETRTNTSDSTATGSSDSTSSGSSSTSSEDIFSDTPQARLAGKDYATNLNEGSTSTSDSNTGKATSETAAKVTSTEEYVNSIKGFDGMKYASEVYMGVKETIINLDKMILDDLNDLFMNVY